MSRVRLQFRPIAVCAGLTLYLLLAPLIAFSHCSRVSPTPNYRLAEVMFLGPWGLMPFHGVGLLPLLLAVSCAVLPLGLALLTSRPRVRRFSALVAGSVWLTCIALASRGV